MGRRLDIGIASYGASDKLRRMLASLCAMSASDVRIFVIDNPGPDPETRNVIRLAATQDQRINPVPMNDNIGYAGAVNKLFELAETDYIGYCDNDVEIRTQGWDERLASILDTFSEIGWVFPGPGHYGFHNGSYHECLWNAGYCWMMRREAMLSVELEEITGYANASQEVSPPLFDTSLGHHEEVDWMIRLRLAGWRIACDPQVEVIHHETATRGNEADHKPGGRIHDGVVRWMNKWNRYFCGEDLNYSMTAYDDRALRYTDWNVDALYLERMTLKHFPNLNANPESVTVPGVGPMDVIKILKPTGCYKNRAI